MGLVQSDYIGSSLRVRSLPNGPPSFDELNNLKSVKVYPGQKRKGDNSILYM